MTREKEIGLRIVLNNTKPVELVDIGLSFKALGELYESYAHEGGSEAQGSNSKLYLVSVGKGSIIADLKAILDQASFVVDHIEVLAGFMTHLTELIEFFRVQRPIKIALVRQRVLKLSVSQNSLNRSLKMVLRS